jgi:hypothetical protein
VALPDFQTYGALIYSLQERYPSIQRSTLVLATIGPTLAKLEGQVMFAGDRLLDVWELIDFEAGCIRSYSYEIYQAGEKIAWYDPFEHAHIPELASTYPHHKHIPTRHQTSPRASAWHQFRPAQPARIDSASYVRFCLPRGQEKRSRGRGQHESELHSTGFLGTIVIVQDLTLPLTPRYAVPPPHSNLPGAELVTKARGLRREHALSL